MYIHENHAECKMHNVRCEILSLHMFSFNIILLVILFPIKLLTQLKQLDFNKPKVVHENHAEIGFKVRIDMRIINYPFHSLVNSKFET